LAWEVENYVRDSSGRIPKERDHLIDCWRYANAAVCFDLADDIDGIPVEPDKDDMPRGYTIEQDMDNAIVDKFDPYDTLEGIVL
jgi:hypothetical protein